MLDISGYGLLRDNWIRTSYDDEIVNSPENIYSIDYICNIKNMLCNNIKSKYIESNPNDKSIIESKSLSVDTQGLRYLNNYIGSYVRDTEDSEKDVFNKFRELYKYYNYRELDIYPIRNYDLLDQQGKLPKDFLSKEYKENIFYDKLIINGGTNRMNIFKTLGPLYNLSLANIPVLTKLYKLNVDVIELIYDLDFNKVNPLITILNVNRCNYEYDMEMKDCIQIIFKVDPHYKTINTTYMNKQDVYIPTLIMGMILNSKIDYKDNIKIINEIYYTSINIIKDLDFYAFKVFNAYNNLSHINISSNNTISNNKLNKFSFKDLIHSHNYDNKSMIHQIVPWPFGNVYEDSRACMIFTNQTNSYLYNKEIENNKYIIGLHNIVNGFYNDFLDSIFNHDLVSSDFFLKETYEKYLDFKESFVNQENGFNKFINILEEYRIKILEKINPKPRRK